MRQSCRNLDSIIENLPCYACCIASVCFAGNREGRFNAEISLLISTSLSRSHLRAAYFRCADEHGSVPADCNYQSIGARARGPRPPLKGQRRTHHRVQIQQRSVNKDRKAQQCAKRLGKNTIPAVQLSCIKELSRGTSTGPQLDNYLNVVIFKLNAQNGTDFLIKVKTQGRSNPGVGQNSG